MVRRLKSTVFLMCKESDTVTEVKKMLAGICWQEVEDIRLYQDQDGKELEGSRQLSELGLTAAVCRPQSPCSLLAAWADEEVSHWRLD